MTEQNAEFVEITVRKVERYNVTEYRGTRNKDAPSQHGESRELCGPTTMAQANEIASLYGLANPEARVRLQRSSYDDHVMRDRINALAAELGMQVVGFIEDNRETYVIVPNGPQYRVYTHGDYIGAGFSVDPREGEDWRRGNDLPDGPYNGETWTIIRERILKLHDELKADHKA